MRCLGFDSRQLPALSLSSISPQNISFLFIQYSLEVAPYFSSFQFTLTQNTTLLFLHITVKTHVVEATTKQKAIKYWTV